MPEVPQAPTFSNDDKTTITIDWTAPQNGGTPITGYTVMWDQGALVGIFVDLTTTAADVTEYTANDLTTGETYSWKIAATNIVGSGLSSESSEAIAAVVPSAPDAPTSLSAD